MALGRADIDLWEDLSKRGLVPPSPSVLEIGQANWYGDVDPPQGCESECSFETARNFYKRVLGYRLIEAVDMNGLDSRRYDLNDALPLEGVFDVVINTGTTEHVFDQRRVFETIHDYCAVGGLMVHAVPWRGWENHGFYCYQPCFFYDLARANDYEMLYFVDWKTGDDSVLYLAMKKTRELPFRVPRQGKYVTPAAG